MYKLNAYNNSLGIVRIILKWNKEKEMKVFQNLFFSDKNSVKFFFFKLQMQNACNAKVRDFDFLSFFSSHELITKISHANADPDVIYSLDKAAARISKKPSVISWGDRTRKSWRLSGYQASRPSAHCSLLPQNVRVTLKLFPKFRSDPLPRTSPRQIHL